MRCSPSSRTSTTKLTNLPPPPVEEEPPAFDETVQIRQEAWTEGYLTGRQEPGDEIADGRLTAKLLTALDELTAKTHRRG